MRTTVTLDDDVFLTVKEEMKRGGKTFKEAVNELIRQGRYANQFIEKDKKAFKLKGRSLKPRNNYNFDSISRLLEEVEGPDFK
jgi:predicted CopG family antitoxin